jgi:hypothetical protein
MAAANRLQGAARQEEVAKAYQFYQRVCAAAGGCCCVFKLCLFAATLLDTVGLDHAEDHIYRHGCSASCSGAVRGGAVRGGCAGSWLLHHFMRSASSTHLMPNVRM